MSSFEKYMRLFVHLALMPFVQGMFYGFGELIARHLFTTILGPGRFIHTPIVEKADKNTTGEIDRISDLII